MQRIAITIALATFTTGTAYAQSMSTDALPGGARADLCPVTIGDYALFAGGGVANVPMNVLSDIVDAYDAATSTWLPVAKLSIPRVELAGTAVGGFALFAGGQSAGGAVSTVDWYDSSKGPPSNQAAWFTWNLSQPRVDLAAATVGSKAMFAGGRNAGTMSNVVDVYDASVGLPNNSAAWSTMSLSVARPALSAVTVGTKVLFAGGENLNTGGASSTVDIYNDSTGLWSTANLSVGRASMGAAAWGSHAYFGGGELSLGQVSAIVDVYNALSDTWTTKTLSQARGVLTATAVAGKVIFAGGYTATLAASDVVDIFDVKSGSLDSTYKLSVPRIALLATTVQDQAMFAGGAISGPIPIITSTVVDVYEPCSSSVAASEVVRLGTPPNPLALLPGTKSGPVLGATWDPVIDHTTFLVNSVTDLLAFSATPTNIPTALGTVLCGATPFLILTTSPGTPFALPIPTDCSLVGAALCTQGVGIDAIFNIALTNALDITIGTY
jgi:hypothetical protein